MNRRALTLGLCVSCCLGFLSASHAQESSGKPEVPTPKTIQSPISTLEYSFANSARNESDQQPQTLVDVSALAASIAARILSAGCQPKNCAVVVASFTLSDGNTSAYGMRLADILSRELANKEYKLRVIDRKGLQTFLAKERVPTEPEHRTVRWISEELNARFIVVGTTEKIGDGVVSASQLIDTEDKKWPAYRAVLKIGPLNSAEDLAPIDPSGPLPVITTSANGEKVERLGANGTTVPSCYFMPNPPYSDDARKLKLNGTVTAEAVVNSKGELENMRIVRGMPGGLNEITIATMRRWRCHPALKDGKPVPVLVPFTVTFRLY